MIEIHRRFSIAMKMLQWGARISIIHRETQIPKSNLRKAYVSLHGKSPAKGQIKFSTRGIIRSRRIQKEVTFFAVCYQAMAADDESFDSIERLFSAYELFKRTCSTGKIDFNAAWVIANDMRAGQIALGRCHHCGAAVLIITEEFGQNNCSVCRTKFIRYSSGGQTAM